jgi:hypothetical protein
VFPSLTHHTRTLAHSFNTTTTTSTANQTNASKKQLAVLRRQLALVEQLGRLGAIDEDEAEALGELLEEKLARTERRGPRWRAPSIAEVLSRLPFLEGAGAGVTTWLRAYGEVRLVLSHFCASKGAHRNHPTHTSNANQNKQTKQNNRCNRTARGSASCRPATTAPRASASSCPASCASRSSAAA